nr:MAG TPA: hypothetical protein [Caudoviricetes sp.]
MSLGTFSINNRVCPSFCPSNRPHRDRDIFDILSLVPRDIFE